MTDARWALVLHWCAPAERQWQRMSGYDRYGQFLAEVALPIIRRMESDYIDFISIFETFPIFYVEPA